MKFRYSRNFFPPAPAAPVTLSVPAKGLQIGPLPAFLDTGADGTLVALRYLLEIEAPATEEMFLRSQWGERRSVVLYLVDVQLGDWTLSQIEVAGDDLSDEIVVGRDVLNQLRVLLNGPEESVEVLA